MSCTKKVRRGGQQYKTASCQEAAFIAYLSFAPSEMDLFDIRFDKPQEFIQVAGSGGQDICGVVIFRFANRFAHVVGNNRVTVSQLFQVILNAVDVQRVAFQRGFCC